MGRHVIRWYELLWNEREGTGHLRRGNRPVERGDEPIAFEQAISRETFERMARLFADVGLYCDDCETGEVWYTVEVLLSKTGDLNRTGHLERYVR